MKGVTSIGDYAFADFKNLEQVIYSSTVKVVSDSAVKNCPRLKIYYKDGTKFKGGLSGGHEYIKGDCVVVIGGTIYSEVIVDAPARNRKIYLLISGKNPDKKTIRKIKIPIEKVEIDSDLAEIEDEAYKEDNMGFPNVNLGDFKRCKRIGKRAFQNCVNIKFAILPPNLQEIDNGAFENCKGLTSIILPPNLSKVGDEIFKGCERLEKIYYKADSDFEDKLRLSDKVKLIPYYKLTPQGGIKIDSFSF